MARKSKATSEGGVVTPIPADAHQHAVNVVMGMAGQPGWWVWSLGRSRSGHLDNSRKYFLGRLPDIPKEKAVEQARIAWPKWIGQMQLDRIDIPSKK